MNGENSIRNSRHILITWTNGKVNLSPTLTHVVPKPHTHIFFHLDDDEFLGFSVSFSESVRAVWQTTPLVKFVIAIYGLTCVMLNSRAHVTASQQLATISKNVSQKRLNSYLFSNADDYFQFIPSSQIFPLSNRQSSGECVCARDHGRRWHKQHIPQVASVLYSLELHMAFKLNYIVHVCRLSLLPGEHRKNRKS